MKPIRLEIENLRSFRKKRAIDFTELEIFAVIGDTGAGKTSILEAITYALFNRSTWHGRNVKELITRGASSMSVSFTFSVDGDEYTILRITRERGPSVHRLMCPARGIDVTSEAGVDAAVRDALHLDDEAFLHTVLLRQDKHAALLTADQHTRNRILSELFRLDDVTKVADLARTHEGDADRYLYSFQERRRECGNEPLIRLREAEDTLNHADEVVARANTAVDAAKMIDLQIAECAKTVERCRTQTLTLAPCHDILRELAAIDLIERDVEPQIGEQRKIHKQAEAEKLAAEAEAEQLKSAGRDTDTLRKIESSLETLSAELREISSDRSREKQAISNAEVVEKLIQDLQTVVTAAEGEHAAAVSTLSAAETSLREQETRRTELQNGLKDRANVTARRDSWLASRDLKAGQEATLHESVERTHTALSQAQQVYDAAATALTQAQVAHQAAAIAQHLHVGDDCPVCHRTLSKDFKPPRSPGLEKAIKAEERAKKQRDSLASTKNRLEAELKASSKTLAEANDELAKVESELAPINQRVQSMLPAASDEPLQVLAQLEKAVVEGQQRVPALRKATERKNKMLSEVRAQLTTAEADRRHAKETIEGLRSAIGVRETRCSTVLKALPKAFRPKLNETDVKYTLAEVRECYTVANRVESRIRLASEAIAAATSKIGDLQQRLTETVVAPRATLYEKLRVIATLLDAPASPSDQRQRPRWAQSVVEAADSARSRLEEEATAAGYRREEFVQSRTKLVAELGGEPQTVASQAALRKRDAERDVEAARKNVALAASLDVKIERLQPVKLGLTSLRTALGSREFPAYATQQRQRRLLEEATIIFSEMTDGRYGFTGEFDIFDCETNKARSPDTLSGGEKFLASLALSLAVVEIASNAGAKIEALFLDEGFASLDAQTLELAMLELRKRSRSGRVICVISHLHQVTQFVNDTILVEETADGSDIKRLSGPIDDDSSIVEGLVSHLVVPTT